MTETEMKRLSNELAAPWAIEFGPDGMPRALRRKKDGEVIRYQFSDFPADHKTTEPVDPYPLCPHIVPVDERGEIIALGIGEVAVLQVDGFQ